MVIPMIVNIKTIRMRTPRAMDLPRVSPLFGRKRHRPTHRVRHSRAAQCALKPLRHARRTKLLLGLSAGPTRGIFTSVKYHHCAKLLCLSRFKLRFVVDENDLTCYATLPEQLLRLPGLVNRESLRDKRLDLLLLQEVEQSEQVLSKP